MFYATVGTYSLQFITTWNDMDDIVKSNSNKRKILLS